MIDDSLHRYRPESAHAPRLPLLGVLMLSACGVGAGGGRSTGTSNPGTSTVSAPPSSALGKRSLPSYLVNVTQRPSAVSRTIVVRVLVTPDACQPQPSGVTCWISGESSDSVMLGSARLAVGSEDQDELSLTRSANPSVHSVWARPMARCWKPVARRFRWSELRHTLQFSSRKVLSAGTGPRSG